MTSKRLRESENGLRMKERERKERGAKREKDECAHNGMFTNLNVTVALV